jgi:hypothetical protein
MREKVSSPQVESDPGMTIDVDLWESVLNLSLTSSIEVLHESGLP